MKRKKFVAGFNDNFFFSSYTSSEVNFRYESNYSIGTVARNVTKKTVWLIRRMVFILLHVPLIIIFILYLYYVCITVSVINNIIISVRNCVCEVFNSAKCTIEIRWKVIAEDYLFNSYDHRWFQRQMEYHGWAENVKNIKFVSLYRMDVHRMKFHWYLAVEEK